MKKIQVKRYQLFGSLRPKETLILRSSDEYTTIVFNESNIVVMYITTYFDGSEGSEHLRVYYGFKSHLDAMKEEIQRLHVGGRIEYHSISFSELHEMTREEVKCLPRVS